MREPLPLRARIKNFRQRLSRKGYAQNIIAFVIAAYIRLVYHTSRTSILSSGKLDAYLTGEKNAIFAFWHGRLLMVPPFKPKQRGMHVLISRHNDGELITRALEFFGIETVRGSSSRGGGKAALGVVRVFRNGSNISITPDGPRGPNRQAQAGIIQLARLCECPIIPIALAGSRAITLRSSWDQLQVALPFGRVVAAVGEPITVTDDSDEAVEAARALLQERLNLITAYADEAVTGGRRE